MTHLIDNRDGHDPFLNLALEEYCVRTCGPDDRFLLLYVNDPVVVIGKHQNPFREADHAFLKQNNIALVRRISGGGAVYHDNGNLNFSLIARFDRRQFGRFDAYYQPIVEFLQQLGLPACLTAKRDIMVNGAKISGNARFTDMKTMLCHGTLLFNADLPVLARVLASDTPIEHAQGSRSVRSRVANIQALAARTLTHSDFKSGLLAALTAPCGALTPLQPTPAQWRAIRHLSRIKYESWDWNYGKTPDFTVRQVLRAGGPAARIHVRKGRFAAIEWDTSGPPPAANKLWQQWRGRHFDPLAARFQVSAQVDAT